MATDERERLIAEIVRREWDMFCSTPNEGGQADCQKRPDVFQLMRRMAHSAHGAKFLESYLADLREAERTGRNFMLEKYARMDNRLPPLTDNELPQFIAMAEANFLEQGAKQRPDMLRRNGSGMFERYLRSELETLSPKTLAIYADEIREAISQGRNPVVERHQWLAAELDKNKR